jgi:uncharacterized protein (TIGR02284 family)
MPDVHVVDELVRLAQVNRDAEAGFGTAANEVRNSELETLFSRYAKQHATFSAELQTEIRRLDGDPSSSGSLGGTLRRGWMDFKAAVSGHSSAALLASCQGIEEHAEAAYAEAADALPTGQTHTLIEKHRKQIAEIRTHLCRLVNETKDGVEFQQNE